MSVIALLACLGFAPSEVKTVTITSRGTTVADVLKQVVDQTQVKAAPGDAAKLPVLIKVKEMPVKDFLETLSEAVGASWHKDGEGVVMRWDPSVTALSLAERNAERLARLNELLKSYDKRNEQNLDWSNKALQKRLEETIARIKELEKRANGNEQWINFGNGQNPAQLVLQEAIKKLPRKPMTELGPNDRLIYSTAPNQFQRPLPYSPTTLGAFLDARNRAIDMVKRVPSSPYVRVTTGMGRDTVKYSEVGELIVRVRSQGRGDYIYIDVLIGSRKGELMATASAGMPLRNSGRPDSDLPKGKIKFRPDSLKLARALAQGNRYGLAREYDVAYPSSPWKFDKDMAEIEPLLRDPALHEPVSFAMADAFFQQAETLKKDLIAYVPDPVAIRAMQRIGGTELGFEHLFAEASQFGCRISNGEILFAGTDGGDPYGESYVDRAALSVLINKVRTQGYLHLKDIADYVMTRRDQVGQYELDYHYLMACAPTIAQQVAQIGPMGLNLYRSAGIKLETAKTGVTELPIEQWAAPIRSEFMKLLQKGQFRTYGPNMTEMAQQEPTESYSENLGSRIALQINITSNDAAWAVDAQGDGRFLYAYQIGARQAPSYYGERQAGWPRTFERFRPAQVKNAYLAFVIRTEQIQPNADQNVNVVTNLGRASFSTFQYRSSSFESSQNLQSVAEVILIGDKDISLEDFSANFLRQIEQGKKQQGPMFSPNQVGYKPIIPPQP